MPAFIMSILQVNRLSLREGIKSVSSKTWIGTQTCLIPKSQAHSSEDEEHVRDGKEERRTVDGATTMDRYQDEQ